MGGSTGNAEGGAGLHGSGTAGAGGVTAPVASGGTATTSGGETSSGGAAAVGGDTNGGTGGATSGGTGGAEGGAMAAGAGGGAGGSSEVPVSLLVFTEAKGWVHDSIDAGVAALTRLSGERDWALTVSGDSSVFSEDGLRGKNVVVFLNNTGDVLNEAEQAAFEAFIRAGNGFVGIHAGGTDTEFEWPWFRELVGAKFREHPEIQMAELLVDDAEHASTRELPSPWRRQDEWYAFETNPRAKVNVLLSIDEKSYAPGTGHMNGDHPLAWYHEFDGGRSFYTALGHTIASYAEPLFLSHIAGGIEWAAKR